MATAVQEFSDLNDVAQATRLVLRLTVAAVLGGLLGIEREHKGKAAGIRTHMLWRWVQHFLCCSRSRRASSPLT